MKKLGCVLLCLLVPVLFSFVACDSITGSSDDDSSGNGGTTTVTVSGSWNGGGNYFENSNGDSLSMRYTLVLTLNHQGNLVQGSFSLNRPVLGTRSGSVTGNASDGQITLNMGCCWTLEGTYTENSMVFTLLETFSSGNIAWIRADGSVTKQ